MKYIRIKNQGEIQPEALHLVGASSKRNQTGKIGQFGSGNKFAMAYLIRNGYELKVFAGINEITITTTEKNFRDLNFKIVNINNEPTSITTEMGKDWQFWQAIREIYSNALDEGGCSLDFVQDIEPKEGETHFYLDVKKDVMEFMMNFDDYFATKKKVIFECEDGRIMEKSGKTINAYRKGIKCFNGSKNSIYDYDFNEIQINENRLVDYYWNVHEKIWDIIFQCTDKAVIMNILHNVYNQDFYESCISDASDLNSKKMSQEFKECLKTNKICPQGLTGLLKPDEVENHIIIPTKVFRSVRSELMDDNVGDKFVTTARGAMFRNTDMNDLQNEILRQAMYFFKEVNFEVPYPIEMAIFDDKYIMGVAYKKKEMIILSDICFERGVNEVVNTIIEEYIHLKYDAKDETRSFQTSIITEFISYMKKVNSFAI